MDWTSSRWFSFSCPTVRLGFWFGRYWHLWPWNLFRRDQISGELYCWGIGLLQVGHRHLFFLGSEAPGHLELWMGYVKVLDRKPTGLETAAREEP